MALIEAYISMSADGYVTGPGLDREPGLGEGGKVLHEWFAHDEGRPYLDELFAVSGAVVTSRKVYEITGGWGEDGLYRMPVFVVTHRPEGQVVKGDTTFTFVTDGIDAALTQAAEAAGDKQVYVMGSRCGRGWSSSCSCTSCRCCSARAPACSTISAARSSSSTWRRPTHPGPLT
jgi:dihydrofolate reductase